MPCKSIYNSDRFNFCVKKIKTPNNKRNRQIDICFDFFRQFLMEFLPALKNFLFSQALVNQEKFLW
ncbi:MAG TPA: hypothetical protein DF409_05710 [Bacteroidales bacterium]|nr:hypothetical protein [Bacteroidales bacterium]